MFLEHDYFVYNMQETRVKGRAHRVESDSTGATLKERANYNLILIRSPSRLPEKCVSSDYQMRIKKLH